METMSAIWTPQPAVLQDLLNLFKQASSPSASVQKRVLEGVEELKRNPDGVRYLVVIFAELTKEQVEVRQMAGLLLKNLVAPPEMKDSKSRGRPARSMASECVFDEAALEFVRGNSLKALYDDSIDIRRTAGTIITTIITEYGCDSYPDALTLITQLIEQRQDPAKALTALDTFKKIAEDTLKAIVEEEVEDGQAYRNRTQPHRFIQISVSHFIPLILKLCDSEIESELRKQALAILEVYNERHAFAYREFAHNFFDEFWNVLGRMALEPTPGIRLIVLRAMLTVYEYKCDAILANAGPVLDLMLTSSDDPNYDVRMEALAFWPELLKDSSAHSIIEKYLPKLIPILIHNVVYTQMDYQHLDPAQLQEDNAAVPDEIQTIAPRFHQSRGGGDLDEDDDDDEPGETKSAWGDTWTVRKAAALSLDALSLSFRGKILPLCLSLIESRLGSPQWEIRESGVLALGAISKGCLKELDQYIPNVLNMLIELSNDSKPLLRSISSWCLQRFAAWFCMDDHKDAYLGPVVAALLARMLDRNKCVQEAAVSAFAALEEVALGLMVPFLPEIFETFGRAFELYQAKNMLILYDAIRTLAEAVGPALVEAHPSHYSQLFLNPLFMRWNQLTPNDHYQASALCDCMGYVAQAVGTQILPMAPVITRKCIELISVNLDENINLPLPERPGTDVSESCLDLLSFLVETLKEAYKPIVIKFNFVPLVVDALTKPELVVNTNLKQSALALIGDVCVCCCELLQPHLTTLIPALAASLSATQWAVCSNASWALGQVVEQVNPAVMEPYGQYVCQQLASIIVSDFKNPSLRQNACITFGRFAGACPHTTAPVLLDVVGDWCKVMSRYQTDVEKIKSFKGLCAALTMNPAVGVARALPLLECATSFVYEEPTAPTPPGAPSRTMRQLRVTPEIEQVLKDMIAWLRGLTGEQWPVVVQELNPTAQQHLAFIIQ
eukprot:Gregarina_sp_Pseudo_9__4444@NODE_45_length_5109_cov_42_945957_g42_i0_p1_GENE_NODE_45_length_5109_cov_42_945957_g42_i0NODE_45_length_5109_cov_42_945957_g42_i0_p1_ORF_typecomplete_len954_score205_07HEAT_EZ/PF13513_6/2_3e02HEAT_EZ/PF13513_6/1_9e03HEAT_EZ/PF13513_6/1_2e12HEAT_EZ/PF13513_6/1_1HEAT_EZ/PF13513_6/0_088HEAT_EZ/PF13513_6/5_7e07HEAT_EZ/PF13513_6/2_3Vac14_Fab1_bd/PF12755_7/4_9e03Vac14_Fab1_bd/PF12755_7/0_21Vac14_Fab1_bd/PF12755_7/8_2e03Vac14_Fab1_bd/PF12755_7/2_3e02Vac14_Fab1_bd/PF12755_7/4